MKRTVLLAALALAAPLTAFAADAFTPPPAGDWPMWGHGPAHNMVSGEKNLPITWDVGPNTPDNEKPTLDGTKNLKWVAKLGSQAYGFPTVYKGKVFIGTNNESPRDPKNIGDRGVLMALDEKTGNFLWQLAVPKLGAGKVSDWEYLGICSSPTCVDDRVYIVTNRCEVVCVTTEGLKAGNVGPFMDENKYMTTDPKSPFAAGPTDADIVWRFDMREDLGVFPHNITSSNVLVVGDKVYATTSNGQDWSHVNIPAPQAPCLVCLNKKDGTYIGEEKSGIGPHIMHCNWSSPVFGEVEKDGKKVPMVFFGGGDGILYGFDPNPEVKSSDDGTLKEILRYDCNPKDHRFDAAGKPIKYPKADGPSEVIGTPVFYKNRIYVAVGQDPEHGEGVGCLSCVDVTKTGDISTSGAVWKYTKINRSLSTPSIWGDLLFIADFSGNVHCLNADTGEPYWVHDTKSHIWGSTLAVDGRVYVADESGNVTILDASKTLKVLGTVKMNSPIYGTPVAANGTLYINTPTHLFAIGAK